LWVVWLFALSGIAGTIVCAIGAALNGDKAADDAESPR
jgi:hypothetical protein